MMHSQKGYLNIVIVLLMALLIALGSYIHYLTKQPIPQAPPEPEIIFPTEEEMTVEMVDFSIVASDEAEIVRERIVAPHLRYYETASMSGSVAYLTLNSSQELDRLQFPYLMTSTFNSRSVQEYRIERSGSQILWWKPDCTQGCIFTSTFRQEYPEIIASFEGQ